ncbi:ATP-dependent DNA helicase MPH1 [Diachasma alloeum]|uniref:ATP-dependent DNA helicase MPH1 n=1 Tax=Diachasma alloeum TaxID=454923 RepID=UPI000738175B|nr:ATP-dependent DNA helicase MPH1 [Diachasma alloeum]
MDLLSQVPLLSCDEETKGFDRDAGNRWIYPENLPVRKYQFTIVKTALFNNTLVCLPTGLGKTFIAAVVMYNYFRWYPKGIIVFLAPTKPLVAQQIDACHDIMGIPISDTVELTGATNQTKRATAWRERRVIFATPQTFQKDLERSIVPTDLIKCIVVDEAHKALGKHAYCESIRMMHQANPYFRILALSATPGSKLEAVQDVIRNLHITHLELRDDTSPDITPYINERKVDIILVDLGQNLSEFKERYIEIMDRHVKILLQYNVLKTSAAHISKGRIFYILNEYKSHPNKSNHHGIIMKTLNILLTMYHAYELIIRHGLRAFVHFYQNHSDKFWLDNEPELQELLENIRQYLGPFPDAGPFMDGSVTEVPENLVFGHGKFETLRSILIQHFRRAENKENNTRAIVFTEYRDIVNEVYVLLLQSRPLIRPQVFVGQAGLKQRQQKKALEDFRSNQVNVLISTSVGEEGLDVGEVDLIVCFDISQHSPTRLVQRMGRTGRKRNGHIIVLVTDGKEHETLQAALSKRDSMNNKVLHSNGVILALHNSSPRMIPEDIQPQVHKIHMTVLPKGPPEKKGRKKKNHLETEKKTKRGGKSKNQKNPEGAGKSSGRCESLMRFLTTVPNDNDEIDNDIVAPKIQETRISQIENSQPLRANSMSLEDIKHADVQLLTNDNETIEFLTLCATRQSKKYNNENNNNEDEENRNLVIRYAPKVDNCEDNFFSNLRIPDEAILDCLKTVKMFVAPVEDELTQMTPEGIISGGVDNYHSPQDFMDCGNNFEDLLNTSESDNDGECDKRESPPLESVDWSHNKSKNSSQAAQRNLEVNVMIKSDFEIVLDDSSDEEIQRSPEICTKRSKSPFQSMKTHEKIPSPECYAENAFENILDEASDEDPDATQFDFNSMTTDVKNAEVGIEENGHSKDSDDGKMDKTLENTETMEMEVDGPIMETMPCSPSLVETADIRIPFSYNSTDRNSEVNNENSLDDEIEVLDIEETQIEHPIDLTHDNKIARKSEERNQSLSIENKIEKKELPQKEMNSFSTPSKNSNNSCDKVSKSCTGNEIQINSHPAMNAILSEREDKSRYCVNELNLTDLEDDFEPWEDMEKIATMPQASVLSESFTPQASTSHTNLANPKSSSIAHPLKLSNQKVEKHVSQRQGPSNHNTSLKNPITSGGNRGKDVHNVSTKKRFPHRTIYNKLLNRFETPTKSSGVNKSTNIFTPTTSSAPSAVSNGKKPNKMFEDDLDDFDWGSDFETPPEVINSESRFFEGSTQPPTKISESTGSSGEFSSSKYFNKARDKPQDKPSSKPFQNSSLNNDKLAAIRATLFSKPSKEFVTQQNSDSDDDFSSTKIKKSVFNGYRNNKSVKTSDLASKTDNKIPQKITSTSDSRAIPTSSVSNFALPKAVPPRINKRVSNQSSNSSKKRRKPMGSRRDRVKSDFIDDEAEESDDYCNEVTDFSDEDDDEDLRDFVSHTQVHDDSVDMKAYYLQSTRSPKKRNGYHLKKPKTPPPNLQIFSQAVEPDTYMYDSFCVSASQEEDEVFADDSDEEITILEEIDHKSSKKRKRGDSVDSKGKRRRIHTAEDNSSDDETENLRAAILEESMMLKKRR